MLTHISQEYMCSWDSDKSISLEIRNKTYLLTLIKVLVQKLEIKHTSPWEVHKDQPSLTHFPFYLQVHAQASSLQTSNTPKQTLNPSSVSFSVFCFLSLEMLYNLPAWGWCTGMTQRDGMGREEGGGFRMGNTCIPVAHSFWYLAKLIQLFKV